MAHPDIQRLSPGLLKLDYTHRGNPIEELAFKLPFTLSGRLRLPHDVLCYRFFLRDAMKAAFPQPGLKPFGPFSGYELKDEFIIGFENRAVSLAPSFSDVHANFNDLLVPCNAHEYRLIIADLEHTLTAAGFPTVSSTWQDYKQWEIQHLKTF